MYTMIPQRQPISLVKGEKQFNEYLTLNASSALSRSNTDGIVAFATHDQKLTNTRKHLYPEKSDMISFSGAVGGVYVCCDASSK